jgi:hypothetical protein
MLDEESLTDSSSVTGEKVEEEGTTLGTPVDRLQDGERR